MCGVRGKCVADKILVKDFVSWLGSFCFDPIVGHKAVHGPGAFLWKFIKGDIPLSEDIVCHTLHVRPHARGEERLMILDRYVGEDLGRCDEIPNTVGWLTGKGDGSHGDDPVNAFLLGNDLGNVCDGKGPHICGQIYRILWGRGMRKEELLDTGYCLLRKLWHFEPEMCAGIGSHHAISATCCDDSHPIPSWQGLLDQGLCEVKGVDYVIGPDQARLPAD